MIGSRSDTHLSQRREHHYKAVNENDSTSPRSKSPVKHNDNNNNLNGSNNATNSTTLPFYYTFCQSKKHKGPLLVNGSAKKRIMSGGVCLIVFILYLCLLWSPRYHADPCEVARLTQLKLASLTRRTVDPTVDWKPEIPKLIHHQWKDDNIPLKYQEWHQKWFTLFPEPEYTHMHWTDDKGRQLIADFYPSFLPTFDNYDYHIKRVDAVRYFALHKYGGIHADLDFEPMMNFYSYLPPDRVSVVESPYQYYEVTQNSLMASPKNDPFWLTVMSAMEDSQHLNVMEATGPKLLDRVFAKTDPTMSRDIHVLPCENFQRIPLGETHVAPFLARFHKELFARLYPMKKCGDFNDINPETSCQFTRHHCSASYLEETGLWDLLFK